MTTYTVIVQCSGRKTGAIGVFHRIDAIVKVTELSENAVRLALHEAGFEHISFPVWGVQPCCWCDSTAGQDVDVEGEWPHCVDCHGV